ncbi:MAG: alcohol dehydrogenase catalytic domain-containing protein [Actinomycetota bacterium]
MKALVYEDIEKVRIDDLPEPTIEEPTDAIVKITSAAICGSDLHFYHGKAPLLPGDRLGHEGMGIVEEVGAEVKNVSKGDRVVIAFDIVDGVCWFCRRGQTSLCQNFRNLGTGIIGGNLGGTHAEYLTVPSADHNLLKVPDDVEEERVLFLGDILTTGFYGAAIAGIEAGDTVAVIGAGPVGYFAAQAVKLHDPGQLLVLDMQADRLELAEKIGATPINVAEKNASSAVSELTDGRGADIVIEAVGAVPAFESAQDVVRSGGRIAVIGMYVTETTEIQLGVAWTRMLSYVFGGICPVHAWWDEALKAVLDGKIDPMPLVSHTMPLDEAPTGFDLFAKREAIKVVLKP